MRSLSCALALCATTALVVAADEFKPEPGFALLFNGKNLGGWQQKGAKKGDTSAALEGKTEAFGKRFVVKDGELVIDPKVKGDRYIETVRQFRGDFTIKYDFKPEDGCNNDTLLLGTKFDIKASSKDTVKGVKLGAWNTMEIVAKGGAIDFRINGEKVQTQKTKSDKGPLILRAEFGPISYKNIRATEEK
ncbi:MAG TPA: DUF1080 domain-containing protein [Gemmata sp.]